MDATHTNIFKRTAKIADWLANSAHRKVQTYDQPRQMAKGPDRMRHRPCLWRLRGAGIGMAFPGSLRVRWIPGPRAGASEGWEGNGETNQEH